MYRDKERPSIVFTLFGRTPKTRILDLFLSNPIYEFTRTEIMNDLGMAKTTIASTITETEQLNIIKTSRKIGKSKLYTLNTESPLVKNIIELVRTQSRIIAQQETKNQTEATQNKELEQITPISH